MSRRHHKTGYHMHRLVRRWFGQGFSASCRCKEMIRKMNDWGPQGCREHLDEIVAVMRAEARRRGWWLRLAPRLPGAGRPMQAMVLLAIERSKA